MPDLPPEDILDVLRRHLAASTPGAQSGAIGAALDFADQAATLVWEQALERPPVERFLLALQAAAEDRPPIPPAPG